MDHPKLTLGAFGVVAALTLLASTAAAHDPTTYLQPEGPLSAAHLFERALDAQRRFSGESAAGIAEAFVAEQTSFDPGPVDVCFWDGTTNQREAFGRVAEDWFEGTSVSLRWRTGGLTRTCPPTAFRDFEMRVALGQVASLEPDDTTSTSWASVGKLGSESGRRVTIFIHPLHLLDPTKHDYIVRHEVGHAAGLLHEFQRVACEGRFHEANIKAFYRDRCRGTLAEKATCAEQAFQTNIAALVDSSPWGTPKPVGEHDSESCMNYLLPDSWMNDPDDFTCRLRRPCPALSEGDTTGIRTVYPVLIGAAPGAAPAVAGPPMAAAAAPPAITTSLLPVPTSIEEFDAMALAAARELDELRAIADLAVQAEAQRTGDEQPGAGPPTAAAAPLPSIEDVPSASGIGQRAKSDIANALRAGDAGALSAALGRVNLEITAAEGRIQAYTLAPEARALLEAAARANTE